MLLQGELRDAEGRARILNATFYLDELRIMYGYDVVDSLKDRFTRNYEGQNPYIAEFKHADSKKDANQCLQLCDLLTGCLYQSLVPAAKEAKTAVRNHLELSLKPLGVKQMSPGFWRQYDPSTLTRHFEKFSAWFWRPNKDKKGRGKQKK